MDWSPGGVKPKTFAASLGIRIMCPSGATCLSVDYCFSEQAQKKKQINSVGLVQSRHQYHLIEMKIVLVMIYGSSVGNHFFQTLAKMASGLKLLLAKMKKNSPCLASDIFFKLANKYQINNTVMFNNLFGRF